MFSIFINSSHLDPISPQTLEVFKSKVNPNLLDLNIKDLRELVGYFVHDAPGDYATYLAVVTVYTLLHVFLCVRETYYVAAGIPQTRGLIAQTIVDGVHAIQAWPARYFTERASHMSIEVETKLKGGGEILGSAGQKRTTGWYIAHDSATDPAVNTFNNLRFEHQYPNKEKLVAERYAGSEMAKVTVPTLLSQWEDLYNRAVRASLFDPFIWYRLKNFTPHSTASISRRQPPPTPSCPSLQKPMFPPSSGRPAAQLVITDFLTFARWRRARDCVSTCMAMIRHARISRLLGTILDSSGLSLTGMMGHGVWRITIRDLICI